MGGWEQKESAAAADEDTVEASGEMSRESGVPAAAADEDTVEARFRPRSNLLNPLRV